MICSAGGTLHLSSNNWDKDKLNDNDSRPKINKLLEKGKLFCSCTMNIWDSDSHSSPCSFITNFLTWLWSNVSNACSPDASIGESL